MNEKELQEFLDEVIANMSNNDIYSKLFLKEKNEQMLNKIKWEYYFVKTYIKDHLILENNDDFKELLEWTKKRYDVAKEELR